MCFYWPLMVDALLCGRLIQLMDGDLGTNAHDCGRGNDNRCDVFGHGWYEVNATECGNADGRTCTSLSAYGSAPAICNAGVVALVNWRVIASDTTVVVTDDVASDATVKVGFAPLL